MRRRQTAVVVATVLSLLLGPAVERSARAQLPDWQLEGLVLAETMPTGVGSDPLARVQGNSVLDVLSVDAVLTCPSNQGRAVVTTHLQHPTGHGVPYTYDDDVTDGFGEVGTTDASRAFLGNGTEVVEGGSGPDDALVRVVVQGGQHQRVLDVVDIQLVLDVQVTSSGGGTRCASSEVLARAVLRLVPDDDNEPTSGFFLVGAVREYEPIGPPCDDPAMFAADADARRLVADALPALAEARATAEEALARPAVRQAMAADPQLARLDSLARQGDLRGLAAALPAAAAAAGSSLALPEADVLALQAAVASPQVQQAIGTARELGTGLPGVLEEGRAREVMSGYDAARGWDWLARAARYVGRQLRRVIEIAGVVTLTVVLFTLALVFVPPPFNFLAALAVALAATVVLLDLSLEMLEDSPCP